ncbi:hypothetical protein AK812_SmicGene34645 [Symbiodinium microadriaticum]|uniref:Uncharacterized protein n=1 Tax=Symbiodinium microadriaticum TaxID=2951 RepID=A0A1Q9CNH6_SYMMI|nr:hypothetical protein AK812_SmicGene34645 [Symbiodinium microadriaticum]
MLEIRPGYRQEALRESRLEGQVLPIPAILTQGQQALSDATADLWSFNPTLPADLPKIVLSNEMTAAAVMNLGKVNSRQIDWEAVARALQDILIRLSAWTVVPGCARISVTWTSMPLFVALPQGADLSDLDIHAALRGTAARPSLYPASTIAILMHFRKKMV